jgi:hypothetical protein
LIDEHEIKVTASPDKSTMAGEGIGRSVDAVREFSEALLRDTQIMKSFLHKHAESPEFSRYIKFVDSDFVSTDVMQLLRRIAGGNGNAG